MHEIERQVLVALPPVWGVDLSITNEVLLVWAAALLTLVLLGCAFRRRGCLPRGAYQNAFEALAVFVEREIAQEGIGAEGRRWTPFLLTLFFFILCANLLGIVPLPSHVKAATANFGVPAALAAIVFGTTLGLNLRRHGLRGFLRKFLPSGLPLPVALLIMPIELVSWLAKPVSLAIRLFANMMAGHTLILIFIALAMEAAWFLAPLPLAGAVLMSVFELFVCLIQAFIFTMLAGMYIKDALDAAH